MNNVRNSLLDHDGGGWLSALRFGVLSIALVGLAFPLGAALIGQTLFPGQARGSLIERDGVVVGSALVAQPFTDARYFQPRPSAANYDPKALAGSNWAPSNPALRERISAASTAAGGPRADRPGDDSLRPRHRLGLGHRPAHFAGGGAGAGRARGARPVAARRARAASRRRAHAGPDLRRAGTIARKRAAIEPGHGCPDALMP